MIGAGAGGLVSARWLAAAGATVQVFERTGALGGIWRPDTGLAYPSLRTNTSKQKSAFSDLPFPDDAPDFPDRTVVLAYLERYADRTGVRGRIAFDHRVSSVAPDGAGWRVDGEPFDAVVVATGLFGVPRISPLPGRERFQGPVLHSAEYRDLEAFRDRAVVVAGAGSSGADIACDLVGVARSVVLAVRSEVVFAPRYRGGRPYDHRLTRAQRLLPRRLRGWLTRRVIVDEYRRRGLRPAPPSLKVTPGTGVLDALAAGRLRLGPGLVALEEDAAVLADGSRVAADAVVLATGYAPTFPFLPPGLPPTRDGALALYRLVFPPGVPGLAFVGLTRVQGAVFPVAELQARWVAAVFSGRAALPPVAQMWREIDARLAAARAAGDDQMRVELLPYLDDLAARIGARPRLWRRPALLVSPVNARDYRT